MNDLRSEGDFLSRLRACGLRYDERAYLFVLASIERLQSRLAARRHVSGRELCHGCREYALEQYGLLARTVLQHWGVCGTGDFGRIVYHLVEVGLLVTRPDDREEDFHQVYSFEQAFDHPYDWQGIPGS
jgi:uncharacterized repeat protein (TIGR04138 family)